MALSEVSGALEKALNHATALRVEAKSDGTGGGAAGSNISAEADNCGQHQHAGWCTTVDASDKTLLRVLLGCYRSA